MLPVRVVNGSEAFCSWAALLLSARTRPRSSVSVKQALLGNAGGAESAFDAAQNGHAVVQPALDDEIPGWNKEKSGAIVGVLAGEKREVHILTDFDAPLPF